jgi:hypothetical protein
LLLKEYPQLIRRPVVVLDDGTVSQGFSDNGFKKLFGIDSLSRWRERADNERRPRNSPST